MSKKYTGGLITKTPVTPAGPYQSNAASGVWTLDQQARYKQQGIWPTAGLTPNYIEDYFSTYLYQQNTLGYRIPVATGVGFISTSAWQSNLLSTTVQAEPKCAFDSAGNYYVAVSEGSTGGYVAKFSSDGTKVWLINLSPPAQFLSFSAIKVSASGNVYVAGLINNAASPFVCKLNSSGAVQWTQYVSGGGYSSAAYTAMELDSSENVHYAYTTATTLRGAYAKFNSSGVQDTTVSKVFYTATQTFIKGITVDTTGNIYICGFYYDSGTTYNYGFVAKFNSSMAIQWNKALYTINGSPSFNGVSVDGSGNVYVTGTQRVTSDEFLIAKYNSSGTLQWQSAIIGGMAGYAIKVDTSGTIYAAGNGSSSRWQILKVSTSGTLSWQSNFRVTTGNNYPYAYGLDIDSSSNLLVVGNTNETTSTSTYRTNLIKINQDGSSNGITIAATLNPSSFTFSSTSGTEDTRTFTVTTGTTFSSVTFTAAANSLATSVTNIAASTSSGAMLWIKDRTAIADNLIFPTSTTYISSNTTAAAASATSYLTSQSSNGFVIPSDGTTTDNFVSWTFKKQAKFFDVVTWSGNSVDGRSITHNLGSAPGCIIVKCTSSSTNWVTWHQGAAGTLWLNSSNADSANGGGQAVNYNTSGGIVYNPGTSTTAFTVSAGTAVNSSGNTYVAYIFASNAGGFGLTGTDNVITCGSYTGAAVPNAVTLGYEPQWVMVKRTDTAGYDWIMLDVMRGDSLTGQAVLSANLSTAEATYTNYFYPTATGFAFAGTNAEVNAAGGTYIYIAIRRGPMRTPTTGTSVFSPTYLAGDNGTSRAVSAGFAPDLFVFKRVTTGDPAAWADKLRGPSIQLDATSTAAEVNQSSAGTAALQSFSNTGIVVTNAGTNINTNATGFSYGYYSFQRAPGFFDEVCYTGNGTVGRTVAHNLSVAPELLLIKRRSGTAVQWGVGHPTIGWSYILSLNLDTAKIGPDAVSYWNNTAPTSTVFTVGDTTLVNTSAQTYVAYLFATCPGVSKVGSYTGTGASQVINCGFTSGARFVMIKRTDALGDWYVWDTARGMVSGTDNYFLMNSTVAQTNANYVFTSSTGFTIQATAPADINASGGTYIYLAIA